MNCSAPYIKWFIPIFFPFPSYLFLTFYIIIYSWTLTRSRTFLMPWYRVTPVCQKFLSHCPGNKYFAGKPNTFRSAQKQQRMRWLDASPTPWTWVWVNSRSWWWTGRPGLLQSMGSQRSDMTELLKWTETHRNSMTGKVESCEGQLRKT